MFRAQPRGVTFGWGVVFSDQTVDNLMQRPGFGKTIADEFAHWDDIDVHFRGEVVRSSGHGFIGIGRKRLLEILQQRATELGVQLTFECEATPTIHNGPSMTRHCLGRHQQPRPRQLWRCVRNRRRPAREQVRVLGTTKAFDAFTFAFEETEAGWIWAHAYRFAPRLLDLHRRMLGCDLGRLGLDGWISRNHRTVARASRQISRRHRLISNAAHLPALQSG